MPGPTNRSKVPEVCNNYPDSETYAALILAKDALVALAASVAAFGLAIWARSVGGAVTLVNATDRVGLGLQNPTSTLHVGGSVAELISLIDADVEMSNNKVVVVDCTGGNRVPTLPQAATCAGRRMKIRATATGGVRTATITPFAGDTVDGGPSFVLSADGDFAEIQSSGGTEWLRWTGKQAGVVV